jgi:hypothetical protein
LGDKNHRTELSAKRVNSTKTLLFVGQNEQKRLKRFLSLGKTCYNNRSVFGLWVQQITKTKSLLFAGKNERKRFWSLGKPNNNNRSVSGRSVKHVTAMKSFLVAE